MTDPSNVAVRCGCCGATVRLSDMTLASEHCDTCEFDISRDMQRQVDLDEAEAEAMATYYEAIR